MTNTCSHIHSVDALDTGMIHTIPEGESVRFIIPFRSRAIENECLVYVWNSPTDIFRPQFTMSDLKPRKIAECKTMSKEECL